MGSVSLWHIWKWSPVVQVSWVVPRQFWVLRALILSFLSSASWVWFLAVFHPPALPHGWTWSAQCGYWQILSTSQSQTCWWCSLSHHAKQKCQNEILQNEKNFHKLVWAIFIFWNNSQKWHYFGIIIICVAWLRKVHWKTPESWCKLLTIIQKSQVHPAFY